MENQQIAEVVKKFDNFVHFSLNHKDDPTCKAPAADCKVNSYLKEMEKRLKLRPRSHEQKFEKILKPMKDLRSFVSVKEFMESLGECAVGRVGERGGEKNQKALKLGYQNARGGYYMERIEQHLRNKKFKRSAKNPPFYVTELEDHSLETSEFRSWIENTLSKIPPKNDQLFKKTEGRIKEGSFRPEEVKNPLDRDCLIEEHQKEYADQFKVVPHMRELCNQEYESFAKLSTLLTGRLRKILKNNGMGKKSMINISNPAFMESFQQKDNQEKSYLRKTTRVKQNKQNSATTRKTAHKKRVQTAGAQRREEPENWRDMITTKLKGIISQSSPEPPAPARPSIVQE